MSDLPMPPLSKQQMQEAREAFNMFDKVRQVTPWVSAPAITSFI